MSDCKLIEVKKIDKAWKALNSFNKDYIIYVIDIIKSIYNKDYIPKLNIIN